MEYASKLCHWSAGFFFARNIISNVIINSFNNIDKNYSFCFQIWKRKDVAFQFKLK